MCVTFLSTCSRSSYSSTVRSVTHRGLSVLKRCKNGPTRWHRNRNCSSVFTTGWTFSLTNLKTETREQISAYAQLWHGTSWMLKALNMHYITYGTSLFFTLSVSFLQISHMNVINLFNISKHFTVICSYLPEILINSRGCTGTQIYGWIPCI
jgi:hypothetical protein